MSKQFAIIPLNFDVLTFSDKSLEKYKERIEMVSAERMECNNPFNTYGNLEIIKTFLMDCNSYFIVPVGENSFNFMLKENAKQFVDFLDCEFSITRRE